MDHEYTSEAEIHENIMKIGKRLWQDHPVNNNSNPLGNMIRANEIRSTLLRIQSPSNTSHRSDSQKYMITPGTPESSSVYLGNFFSYYEMPSSSLGSFSPFH